MIIPYNQIVPTIGKHVFIAPTAVVIGDVTIGDGASIWFNAVLRGDMAPIVVGAHSNIQDNCTIHTDFGKPAVIGDRVTVGHNAVIHGCTIDNGSLVGIGAIVLNDAHVMEHTVVAAGSVVREGARVGPRQLVAGAPAGLKKELGDLPMDRFERSYRQYLTLAGSYLDQKI
ncbi:gamma carbonic anhydrase family protein [Desulfosarcina alkanivorans]|uniref:Gamma carbonic anhydrase family protein n=1 Tax=Desulfosarcina alkanivorans TaxID=571177 RepID=A0A5K7YCU3_9BACT|nr:gamma carbonic anhydrase family protein [Desulfosarcina alkanivorans]BBO66235.1 gamma carbonic anhydrase family protein [Desulfosarcina alkanivorans]